MVSGLHFQSGGSLQENAIYVARPADRQLLEALQQGEPAHVLAPRQMGKSSLRLGVERRLRQQGSQLCCVTIELTELSGQQVTQEQWFFTLVDALAARLRLGSPREFWHQRKDAAPAYRFTSYIDEVVLAQTHGPLCLFFDELDALFALDFGGDDFLGALRTLHDRRAEDPRYRRLNFCLLGVAAEHDLMKDPRRMPLSVSRTIRLEDFTLKEMQRFSEGLQGLGGDPQQWLQAIYHWTSGHPYMTQKLCKHLLTRSSPGALPPEGMAQVVAHVVEEQFFRRADSNLGHIDHYFHRADRLDPLIPQILHLYHRILRKNEQVLFHEGDEAQVQLRLLGLCVVRQQYLRSRNRILARVFNQGWVQALLRDRLLAAPLILWVESGRSSEYLLRGQRLQEARRWVSDHSGKMPAEELDFLTQSLQAAEEEAKARERIATTQAELAEHEEKLSRERAKHAEERARLAEEVLQLERRQKAQEQAELQRKARQRRQRLWAGAVLTCGLVVTLAGAGYYQWRKRQADALFKQCITRDHGACMKLLDASDEACEGGSAEACLNVGALYDYVDVMRNLERAAQYYERACQAGDGAGCHLSGYMFASGRGVERKDALAFDRYLRACQQGVAIACNNVGYLYEHGRGTRQDHDQAAAYYQRACSQQVQRGCVSLGFLYQRGIALTDKPDLQRAKALYKAACAVREPRGCASLGFLVAAEDPRYAAELYERACMVGDGQGCNNLGDLYERGVGVAQDPCKAQKLYNRAAEQRYPYAFLSLGGLYERGLCVGTDRNKALELYWQGCQLLRQSPCEPYDRLLKTSRGLTAQP